MHAQSRAFVVHRTPTRVRIKIPKRRRQQVYFESLERVLHQHPDVLQVHSNPLTAGVIIECRKGFELTVQHRRFLGLEMEPDGILRANSWSGYDARPSERIDLLSPGTLTFAALILKLVVAITTRQVSVQLIEWIIDAFVQAARHEAQGRAARQRALLVPSE